jgi:hypothetical protein
MIPYEWIEWAIISYVLVVLIWVIYTGGNWLQRRMNKWLQF